MKNDKFDDIFTDIDNILPPNNPKGKLTRTVTVSNDGKINYGAVRLGELISDKKFEKGLITGLQIRTWGAEFDFYNEFLQYAIFYHGKTGEKRDYIPFFSFIPQYSRMSRKQLEYYLYWRISFLRGEYIRTDFSYILLYIYEIINLPEEKLSPLEGVVCLARIWQIYRGEYPQLDKYLSEWIPDYCLIHSVKIPDEIVSDFICDILIYTSLPEFYLNDYPVSKARIAAVISNSEYDYRKSKYYQKNRELFDRHMLSAVGCCFPDDGKPATAVSVIRDSYIGALCLFQNKRRMTLTYKKITDRRLNAECVTECIKYTENLIRSGLGIRSRYSIDKLPHELKSRIDDYFSGEISSFVKMTPELKKIADRRYEPESHGFSPGEAERIERESRSVAEMLEGNFDDSASCEKNICMSEAGNKIETPLPSEKNEAANKPVGNGSSLSEEMLNGLNIISSESYTQFESYCKSIGLLPEAVVDEINYYAFLTIGDIVLENNGGAYSIVEDYREEIDKWIMK